MHLANGGTSLVIDNDHDNDLDNDHDITTNDNDSDNDNCQRGHGSMERGDGVVLQPNGPGAEPWVRWLHLVHRL